MEAKERILKKNVGEWVEGCKAVKDVNLEEVDEFKQRQDASLYTPQKRQAFNGSLFVLYPHRSVETFNAILNSINDQKNCI